MFTFFRLLRAGTTRFVRPVFLVSMLLLLARMAQAQSGEAACGVLSGDRPHFGPIDFRKANKQQLDLVEGAHFTPGIESLTKSKNGYFGDGVTYTLRVFPNHHRALITLQRLAERRQTDETKTEFSVPCYFDRAIRYTPDDHIVRMLFASYLIKQGNADEATRQLDIALRLAGDNPFTHYNVGLVFLDMKKYERAVVQAHRAAELGLTRTELKAALVAAGKWVEPGEQTKP